MKFDKDKCLKLLKERKSLQKEGKLLENYDKAKHDELIGYLIWIEDQIFWESRKEYIQILDLFGNKKITRDHFSKQFGRLRGSNLRSARMWEKKLEKEALVVFPKSNEINIQVNPKSYGFTDIISNIHSLDITSQYSKQFRILFMLLPLNNKLTWTPCGWVTASE